MAHYVVVATEGDAFSRSVKNHLELHGYRVECVESVDMLVQALTTERPHLVALDMRLAPEDAVEFCRMIHETSGVPLIAFGPTPQRASKADVLYAGADDFVEPSINASEFLARVATILRRYAASPVTDRSTIRVGPVSIDTTRRLVTLNGDAVKLTRLEYELLKCMAERVDQVVTYQALLQAGWGQGYEDMRVVHTHVSHLRLKLAQESSNSPVFVSVPAVGYRMVP